MFNKRKIISFLVVLVIAVGIFGGGFWLGQKNVIRAFQPKTVDFSLFWNAYNVLHQKFIMPEKIDDQEVVYGAIAGMTKSLQDPYTDFFDPVQAKAFNQNLEGSFEGIGAEIAIKKDQLMVVAPLKGTPADKAGIKAGDLILKIDEKSTADMSTQEAVNLIRGKGGTKVTLTIFREGWSQSKDITITRATIKVNSIDWELKNGDVAHISIHQFDQSLLTDFKKVASEVLRSSAKKIVLDMRNNPGGYLEVCQEIAGWFLKQGQIVTIEDFGKANPEKLYKASGNGVFVDYPTVVLMNKGSASASEILAGALRDNRSIKIIGEKSFGKGSVQEVVLLQDNKSFLKITIAKWLTPKGVSISEVGLTPDIKVSISDQDVELKKDPQLDRALEVVNSIR